MLVEEYTEEIIVEEGQEQPEQGSVVREEAPWQHIRIREHHKVEREVDLMVLMLGWESNFARTGHL